MKLAGSSIYCLSLAVAIGASCYFAMYSGFWAPTVDGGFACKDLKSSGSDDEVVMLYFVSLLPSMAYRMIRWRYAIGRGELVGLVLIFAATSCLAAIGMDCGDFIYTAFNMRDRYLLLFMLGTAVALSTSASVTMWSETERRY